MYSVVTAFCKVWPKDFRNRLFRDSYNIFRRSLFSLFPSFFLSFFLPPPLQKKLRHTIYDAAFPCLVKGLS
ncbi:hypothetical protein PORCRE_819 [Porphyromonas crevioricanis JCM 15906]|uniref:Uncharacterized protein n=1 Tax=Porphyromonas crevioricanis JCM 15906 TaxID=1305617 RepID=T1CH32_9PORP|nr:hypothetical protein PORCRE_819 [Porphyromonas crevioricanis JCM 15906]